MKVIKYFDKISKEVITLEVSDEIARTLWADNKKHQRNIQKDNEYIAFSLDEQTSYNNENELSYYELVEDEKANIEQNAIKQEFYNLIWKVVDKLDKKEKYLILAHFKYGYSFKEIAKKLEMTAPNLAQFKETTYKHLHYLFGRDKDFFESDYYQNNYYKPFAEEVITTAENNLLDKDFTINLSKTLELTKEIPQANKIAEKLGVPLDEETKDFFNMANKRVGDEIKSLQQKYGKDELSLQELAVGIFDNFLTSPNERKDKKVVKETKQQAKDLFDLLEDFAENMADQILDLLPKK